MIHFKCKCGEELEAAEDEAGYVMMCPKCEAEFRVPRQSEAIQAGETDAIASSSTENVTTSADDQIPAIRTPVSTKAGISAILGVLSLCLPILLSIPAMIVGFLAFREIRRSHGELRGAGQAVCGFMLGFVSLGLTVMLVPVVHNVRVSAVRDRSQNNLRQIALALRSMHDVDGVFPQQAIYGADGRPLLSWRVKILPYIEQAVLYNQFKLDEPWDSTHNYRLIQHMPAQYQMPAEPVDQPRFSTFYQGFVGKNAFFRASHLEKVRLVDVTDGPENTFMVVEAGRVVPWTKPEDMPYQADQPLPKLGAGVFPGFNAVLVDGSAIHLDPSRVSEKTIRDAITVNDGNMPGPDWPGK